MKKKIYTVLIAAVALCVSLFAFSGCSKTERGLDGKDFDLFSVYRQLLEQGEFEGTYSDFVRQYLNVNVNWDEESSFSTAINTSLASVVSVQVSCEYTYRSGWSNRSAASVSAGSGVIYSLDRSAGDAYIVTNCHVVYDAFPENFEEDGVRYTRNYSAPLTYTAYLYGLEYSDYAIPFTVVGYSMEQDVAVLRVENSDVLKDSLSQAVTVGNSDDIAVGDRVYLIGNPLGEGISATAGIVSVESEEINIRAADGVTGLTLRAIRTDASANHGNSGGGMFGLDGKLLGILFAGDEEAQGVNSVLPVNAVQGVADSIIDAWNGRDFVTPRKAVAGINVRTASVRQVYNGETNKIGTQERIAVDSVQLLSPSAGRLQQGDVLLGLSLGDYAVKIVHSWQISDFLWRVRPGDTVNVTVERGGEERTVQIAFDTGDFAQAA